MIKDIKYSGYSAVPSDYECPDGTLAVSINLIPEDGSLRPVLPPKNLFKISDGERLLFIHNVHHRRNYILQRTRAGEESVDLYWLKHHDNLRDTSEAVFITTLNSITSMVAVGNTLIAVSPQAPVQYLLFKDESYVLLGSRPPFTSIEFALYFSDTLAPAISSYKVNLPTRFSSPHTSNHLDSPEENQRTRQLQDEFDNILFAYLNSHVEQKVTSLGRFHQPFFVRYAYRLYDGTHSWHSSPVLMIPTTIAPPISISGYDPHNASSHQNVILSGHHIKTFSLYKRIIGMDKERLNSWKDIVTHIDIFITPPIYTYLFQSDYSGDSSDPSADTRRASSTSRITRLAALYEEALDMATPPIEDAGITLCREPLGSSTTGDRDNRHPSRVDGDSHCYFEGHYIQGLADRNTAFVSGQGTVDNLSIDRIVSINPDDETSNPYVIAPPYNPKLVENIKAAAAGEFRFFASIEVEKLVISDKASYLSQESKNLSNIQARQTLDDDARSHADISSGACCVYNSRLHLADITHRPAPMLPLRSAIAMSTPVASGNRNPSLKPISAVEVLLRKNGTIIKSSINCSSIDSYSLYRPSVESIAEIPRYIFYPDPDAFCLSIMLDSQNRIDIPLTKHDFLDGAYFFGGIAEKVGLPSVKLPESQAQYALTYSSPGTIKLSLADNPFFFPHSAAVSVGSAAGNTRVIAICSAAKALSQGQFGQFPLYAFTTEGVWAMEISSTGTYSARQPITRDVCINADGITQIDSAVLFPTDRGIMLICGSNVQCISDAINTETPFDARLLPGMDKLHSLLGHDVDTCIPTIPFTEFLEKCGMLYDYVHQRIIVYHPEKTYAYVYSLKSKEWGMMYSNILAGVNSYPDALAIDKDYNLVNFALPPEEGQKGLMVTRPLKLETPDILKTIDTVIQRGHFIKGHVQSVLYGSRDLYNWQLIWSSKDHYLRGFRGTPYKYFRIACVTSLSEDESIFGASVQFTPRHTNQPR